ncbi:MFS general substrate transporter [Sistotremastrum niveocremeum HHB9708]|uniref:MFS general substrate transporter n=1 Tax=Sistotremastrum niveocremeum HHB9708 TaxID=1314777 RepID=A0A164S7H5_9AGAM|nr:MFS general substrate transporter [Sistotremastrum niveocremeum HHB9708]
MSSATTLVESQTIELAPLPRRVEQNASLPTLTVNEPNERTVHQKRLGHIHFGLLCLGMFMGGWNSGGTGPLLPKIQKVYGVDFATVSLLFLSNSIGFFIGGLSNMKLTDKLGFGRISLIGASSQTVGFSILASAPPFPFLCVGFLFVGWGIAIVNMQANMHVTAMQGGGSLIGFLHASFGIGALIVPLSTTRFAQMTHWSYHYLIAVGIAILDCGLIYTVFGSKRSDELLTQTGMAPFESTSTNRTNKFKRLVKLKTMHLIALWAFVYVGVEVSIGGWISTFLIDLRGASPSAGYVSTGFWGGLTLGRVAFVWVNKRLGEMRVLLAYTVIAIGLQITVWRLPSLLENAIAVSFVGLFLGPMYPIAIRSAGRLLPRSVFSGALGWVAALGQTGGALLPFVTGILATKYGISVLEPVIVSLMCAMFGLWALVPTEATHQD